jgi:hypothetical protein
MITLETFTKDSVFDPQSRYTTAYRAWREVWGEEYALIYPGTPFHSDNFTRQDQVVASFDGDECTSVTLFHEVNIAHECARHDSYFKPWPKDILDEISKLSERVLVWSALTIPKRYRGQTVDGFPVKDILVGGGVYHYLEHTNHTVMVGTTRNTRKANDLCYRFGAKFIRTVECNSEPSDLVIFKRNEVPPLNRDIHNFLKNRWVFANNPPAFKVA